MDITLHTTFLPHTDPEASLAFYRDLLGFELTMDVGEGAMRWLTFVAPSQPDVRLVLNPPAADPGITDDERRTIVELMAKGSYQSIILATKDLDAGSADCRIEFSPTDHQACKTGTWLTYRNGKVAVVGPHWRKVD